MPLKSIPRLPCLALPLTFLALLPMTDSPGFWQFLHCSSIDEDRKIRDEYSNENQLQPSSPSVRLLGCLDVCALVFLNAYHVLGCVCVCRSLPVRVCFDAVSVHDNVYVCLSVCLSVYMSLECLFDISRHIKRQTERDGEAEKQKTYRDRQRNRDRKTGRETDSQRLLTWLWQPVPYLIGLVLDFI